MGDKEDINLSETSGARLEPKYHAQEQDIVGVPVMDIRDASSSAKEEVLQFSVGGFLASGAFWLGVERLLTVGYSDALFLVCIAFFICGVVLAYVGFRQTMRRVSRLERYLPEGESIHAGRD